MPNESNHVLDGLTVVGAAKIQAASNDSDGVIVTSSSDGELTANGALVQPLGFAQRPLSQRLLANSPTMIGAGRVDSHFQAGHAWTTTNTGAGTDTAYTSDFALEDRCVKLVTNAGGAGTPTRLTLSRTSATSIVGKAVRVWLKLDAATASNISIIVFYVGNGASAFASFSYAYMVDYSSGPYSTRQYSSTIKPGEWFPVTLHPSSFRNGITGSLDLANVQDWRVTVTDTGAAATVYVGGVELVAADSAYPNGVVSYVFDDGWDSQWSIAAPYMDRYGHRGTFAVIGDLVGSSGYMTQAQLDVLHLRGHEICPHAYYIANHNADSGTTGFVTLSNPTVLDDFGRMKSYCESRGYRGSGVWVKPIGASSATTLSLVAKSFGVAVDAGTGLSSSNIETLPVADPLRLRRRNTVGVTLSPNTTVDTLQWYIDQVYTHGGWLIFMFHKIAASEADGLTTSTANFQGICDYVNTKGVPVRTVGQVMYG